MNLKLNQVGKRYRYEWIFSEMTYEFKQNEFYAILGPNGVGKSTLMKILSGHLSPSEGSIDFYKNEQKVEKDAVYKQVSFAAPYIELIEEYTLKELVNFHHQFKSLKSNINKDNIQEILQLPKSAYEKEIRFFSSGMKQRMKLGLAFLSNTSLLLLDEPSTNLDSKGVNWYLEMIEKHTKDKTVIIASNEKKDFSFCSHYLNILDYK